MATTNTNKMLTSQEQELIGVFSSVTGADVVTAQHILEAHAWDLNNSVEFFLEQGVNPCPPSLQEHPVSIDEEFDDAVEHQGPAPQPVPPTRIPVPDSPPVQGRRPIASHDLSNEDEEEDDMLQRLLNQRALYRGGTAAADNCGGSEMPELIESDGLEDDDVEIIDNGTSTRPGNVAQRNRITRPTAQNGFASSSGGNGSGASFDDDMDGAPPVRQRRSRPRGAAAAAGHDLDALQELGRRLGVPNIEPFQMPPMLPTRPRMPASLQAHIAGAGGRLPIHDDDELQLPDGINVEEARMLEAAMLGIPYEGRMPAIDEPWQPAAPPAPEVVAQRQLREEQDAAYQASLLADMEKAQAAKRAEAEAQAAQQRRAAEAAAAVQAERAAEQLISDKRAWLPAEPAASDADAITVLVRLPNGGRPSRRFTKDTALATLFDWVDINVAPEIQPGTFRLVTPFPRRMLLSGTAGSLQDSGLTQKQEALFLEPI